MIRKTGNRFSEKIMLNKKIEWDDGSKNMIPDRPDAQRSADLYLMRLQAKLIKLRVKNTCQ
ncbi:hypothetical protein [Bradyrhizobium sp. CSA112]|uniref:hypothetical protein n=1 Tax=Bradyrhizobium sp. CSA112 TaxID=2699170 RepID=UPI0023B07D32|nr:hypothetical protein [Bradyrhizobium sp. CSA112]